MKILQTPTFAKQLKKLHGNQKKDLDNAIIAVVSNPTIGDLKKGDLNGVHVYKFNMVKQLTLLAYEYQEDEQELILLSLGSHENFYRDLKKDK
jgi:mRNA-degrading endonuclease YafQ of YafQ-DinJ toxin-antitoxin module